MDNQREEQYGMENAGKGHGGYAGKNSNSGAHKGPKAGNSRRPGGGSKRGNSGGGKSSFASPEMLKAVCITAAVPALAIAYVVIYFVGAGLGVWS